MLLLGQTRGLGVSEQIPTHECRSNAVAHGHTSINVGLCRDIYVDEAIR